MSERPEIPAALKRRILVEAGHKCAIHRCGQTDVEFHHIIPWATCKEHRYDNLIALCPNCHRRAEKNIIDRKSLRMYKAQLAASIKTVLREAGQQGDHEIYEDEEEAWVTRTISESNRDGLQYTVDIEYPQFRQSGGVYENVNMIQKAKMLTKAQRFRASVLMEECRGDENNEDGC